VEASSAFGIRRALSIDELSALRTRVARASRAAADLESAVIKWQAGTTFSSTATVEEPDRMAFDLYVEASRTYPHDKWAVLAGELGHNARSALDNLNDRLFAKYATGQYDANRIQFPITTTGTQWRKWKQSHGALPDWLIARYEKVQPRVGPYRGLQGLSSSNNSDKHVWLQRISLALTNLPGRGTLTIEGVDPGLELTPVAHDLFLERGQRRVHIATARGNRRILEMPQTAENDIDPVLHFHVGSDGSGDRFYTLAEIAEIPRRVDQAIDYVNGDDSALSKYQAVPS
jgi:hypothetical protein